MTTLKIEQIQLSAAMIGPENPLPQFRSPDPNMNIGVDDSVPESDKKYLGWETSFRVLPHRMQDIYGRDKEPHEFTAAILENDFVKAVVLPEMGGRLISLIDKKTNIELLEPVTHIQPANIALRNAWFAGGVEWNTAQLGHHYLTCAPMFAARVVGMQGEPVLRLYAWERTKCFPYEIDFHLPPDSRFLFVRPRIINRHDHEIPMYWWSNIAVPQSPDRRTLVPADSALYNTGELKLSMTEAPMLNDFDFTYATNHEYAREIFFRIPEGEQPWIANLDGKGRGLVHTSTSMLKGRKMFVWGTSRGGERWQDVLLGNGRSYLEIQGGLARTQLESVPMPAKTEWAWTEAYGLMKADPAKVHSSDWQEAYNAVGSELDFLLPRETLDRLDSQFAYVSLTPPEEMLFSGDGWGSLEQLRMQARGAAPNIPSELLFTIDQLGPDQDQWLVLLRDGFLPKHGVLQSPGHYMVQPEWQKLLEESIERGPSNHWLGWLHLGVMKLENFDEEGARAAWLRSIECQASGWAYANLAVLEMRKEDFEAARDLWMQAWGIGPNIAPIAIECANVLEKLGEWDSLREFVSELPEEVLNHERMRIVSAKLALHYGDFSRVEEILSYDFATIREGEVTLSDLWFTWQAKLISERESVPMNDELLARVRKELVPPLKLDMRMAGEGI